MKMPNKKLVALPMLLVFGLLMTGFAYAHWSQTIYINGTVASGSLDWKFNAISCLDDTPGSHDYHCYDNFEYGVFWRGNKDVGITSVAISADPHYATVTLENVYPCYFTSISVYPHNIGSTPIKFDNVIFSSTYQSVTLRAENIFALDCSGDGKPDIEISFGDHFGFQLEPCHLPDPEISFWIHVLQDAPQDNTLNFTVTLNAVQWDAYVPPVQAD